MTARPEDRSDSSTGSPRIAIVLPVGVPYFERILRGVMAYAREHGPWRFVLDPEAPTLSFEALARFRGEGVIGSFATRAEVRRARRLRIPVVNVSSALADPGLPSVLVDNRAIGRLGAEHLLERGFRRFAYYGLRDAAFGVDRGIGFLRALRRAGLPCARRLVRAGPVSDDERPLRQWLARLPFPLGILGMHDYRARAVLEACAALGRAVPREVAVLGVDDDAVTCELCEPPLSSIALPGLEVGRRSAELLDQLMQGRRPPAAPIRVPPTMVTARTSTDALALSDEKTAAFARFLRGHFHEPLNVAVAADRVGLSRRLIERRFHETLGISPHDYLTRLRVERSKTLLTDARDIKLGEIARSVGFGHVRRLNAAFAKLEGMTPREFRKLHER